MVVRCDSSGFEWICIIYNTLIEAKESIFPIRTVTIFRSVCLLTFFDISKWYMEWICLLELLVWYNKSLYIIISSYNILIKWIKNWNAQQVNILYTSGCLRTYCRSYNIYFKLLPHKIWFTERIITFIIEKQHWVIQTINIKYFTYKGMDL